MSDPAGRVSVVTGAARGIGRAAATALVDSGDVVFALDVDVERGSELEGDRCRFLRCDVTSEADVEAVRDEIERQSGRVDVLVNNAGGFPDRRRLEEVTLAEWNQTLSLNLTSVFLVTKGLLGLLRRSRQARVINIGSLSGQTVGWQTSPGYVAAKAGVHALTRAMAAELAEEGITVNAIAPSAVLTERIEGLRTPEELEATASAIPLGRYQSPEELAEWIKFLASPQAGFMTGQTVSVNGGRFMT